MNFGDCVPVILYCGDGAIIAHAGWRGTVQKMAQTAVKRMTTEFGVDANEIKAVIGPAICLDCFQVGEDVYDGLYGSVTDHTEGFRERYGEYYAGLLLHLAGPEVYAATPAELRAQKTIDTLVALRQQLADLTGLPTTLSQTGKVQPADFPAVARKALNDGAIIVNPAQADYDDVLALPKEVWA